MPRDIRAFVPGVTYHLISRFVERKFFVTTQLERDRYLQLQSRSLKRTDWRLLGFAIMSNHIHLAAVAGRRSFDRWLRPVHSPFADELNETHERIGPIFVRGPKAYAVPNARVAHLLAYIHNNPVRAGVCANAGDTAWTSHRAYIGSADAPLGLDVKLGLRLAGIQRGDFDRWVNHPDQRVDRSFSEEAHELELQLAKDASLAMLPTEVGLARDIVIATADVFSISALKMRSASRGRLEVLARAVAVQCSARFTVSESAIGRALNISQQRVSVLRRRPLSDDVSELVDVVYDRVITRVARPVRASRGDGVSSEVVL